MRRFGFLVSAQIVFAACVYAQCPVDFDWASVRRFYLTEDIILLNDDNGYSLRLQQR